MSFKKVDIYISIIFVFISKGCHSPISKKSGIFSGSKSKCENPFVVESDKIVLIPLLRVSHLGDMSLYYYQTPEHKNDVNLVWWVVFSRKLSKYQTFL